MIIVVLALAAVGAAVLALPLTKANRITKITPIKNPPQLLRLPKPRRKLNCRPSLPSKNLRTKTFTGSSTYGSITFKYPNTWSSYVDQTNTSEPIQRLL